MFDYARTAHERGLKVIIAGAGGAAHLPGMVAAMTPLPVVGVPVKPAGAHLDGLDALMSIVQVGQTVVVMILQQPLPYEMKQYKGVASVGDGFGGGLLGASCPSCRLGVWARVWVGGLRGVD